jgi:hypothetical protein
MTTINDLVNQIDRQLLIHYVRPLYDYPAASFSNVQSTVQLSVADNLSVGALLDVNFELMHVRSFNQNTRTATVTRGFLGTTAASGDSSSLVRINPRITSVAMYDSIVDELNSWDERVFAVVTDDVVLPSATATVEVTPTRVPYRLLFARLRGVSSEDVRRHMRPRLYRSEPTAVYASGYTLGLPYTLSAGDTLDVAYAMPFDTTALTSSSNLETTHGLTAGMLEVLKWGALARITAGKEIARLDTQTVARPDLEQAVPATAHLQASAQYMKMRDMAYDREALRLLGQYPWRF